MFQLPKSFSRFLLLAFCTVTTPALATTATEFYNAGINHYFMTASSDEAAFLDSNASWGWTRTGNTFNIWLTQSSAPSSASPVCRFYGVFANGTVGSHFYTVDPVECEYVKSRLDWGWGYEGDAFYAVKPTGGSCPSGTSPIYRAYNNGMGGAPNHRYMTNQTDVNTMVSQGWVSEGTAFCGAPSGTGTGGTTGGTSTYQSAYDACYNGTPALYTRTYCAAYANAIVAGSTPAAANLAGAVAAGSNVGNIGMGQPITATGTPTSTSMSGTIAWTVGNQYSGAQINYKFYDSANNLVWPSSSTSYVSNYSDTRTANLNCISGANICIGASSGSLSWGVGLAGNSSCTTCCYSCDGGTHSYTFGGSSGSTPSTYYWANWTCPGPQCAAVMGRSSGSAGPLCTQSDCTAFTSTSTYVPLGATCSTTASFTKYMTATSAVNGVCFKSGVDF